MRYIARHEGAGAWPADCDCVANLEGDLATQDVSDLVAVVMEMHRGHGADRCHLLEYHNALVGLAVPQLEGGRAAGGHLPRRPLPGHYDQAVCIHRCLLYCLTLPLNLVLRCPKSRVVARYSVKR